MSKTKEQDDKVIGKITGVAKDVYGKILANTQPQLSMPLRSLQNVSYDPKVGYFELVGKFKERTLTASTVKTFAQTLKMMSLSKELVKTDDIATKREAYYVSKNWGEARFNEQPESDMVMDDIEAMLMVNREQLGFIPEEKGGDVSGKLIVIDQDTETGKDIEIDCTKFGSGAYSVPSSVEHLQFDWRVGIINIPAEVLRTAGLTSRSPYEAVRQSPVVNAWERNELQESRTELLEL